MKPVFKIKYLDAEERVYSCPIDRLESYIDINHYQIDFHNALAVGGFVYYTVYEVDRTLTPTEHGRLPLKTFIDAYKVIKTWGLLG